MDQLLSKISTSINDILKEIRHIEVEEFIKSTTSQIPQDDSEETSPMISQLDVGREVDVAANDLVDHLVGESIDEKCQLFAIVGMPGTGKTTLAAKIFNHPKIKTFFNLMSWVYVSQTKSENDMLKQVIRDAGGNYRNCETKAELHPILANTIVKGESLFLVLDNVENYKVWDALFKVPLKNTEKTVRVLVTTSNENIAKNMRASYVHRLAHLPEDS